MYLVGASEDDVVSPGPEIAGEDGEDVPDVHGSRGLQRDGVGVDHHHGIVLGRFDGLCGGEKEYGEC